MIAVDNSSLKTSSVPLPSSSQNSGTGVIKTTFSTFGSLIKLLPIWTVFVFQIPESPFDQQWQMQRRIQVDSKELLAGKSLALCIQMQRPVHPDCGPNYLEHCSLQSMHQPPFPFPHPNPPCPSPQNQFPFRPFCVLRLHRRLRCQPSPFPQRNQGVWRNAPTKRSIPKCWHGLRFVTSWTKTCHINIWLTEEIGF